MCFFFIFRDTILMKARRMLGFTSITIARMTALKKRSAALP
jgi:hypothetical protein